MSALSAFSRPRQRGATFPFINSPVVDAQVFTASDHPSRYYSATGQGLLRQAYGGLFRNAVAFLGGPNDESIYTEQAFYFPSAGTVTIRLLCDAPADAGQYRIYINNDIFLEQGDTTGIFLRDFRTHTFPVNAGQALIRISKIGGTRLGIEGTAYEIAPLTPLPVSLIAPFSGNDLLWNVYAPNRNNFTLNNSKPGEVILDMLDNTGQINLTNRQGTLTNGVTYLHRFRVKCSKTDRLTVAGANGAFADLGLARFYNAATSYRTIANKFTTTGYVQDNWYPPSYVNQDLGTLKDGLPQFNLSGMAPITLGLDRNELVVWNPQIHGLPCVDEMWDVFAYYSTPYWSGFSAGQYGQYGGLTGYGTATLQITNLTADCWLDVYGPKAPDLTTATTYSVSGGGSTIVQQYAPAQVLTNINGPALGSLFIPACPPGSAVTTRTVSAVAGAAGCNFNTFHLRPA